MKLRSRIGWCGLLGALACVPATAALEGFIKLGSFSGESRATGYAGWSPVHQFGLQFATASTAMTPTGFSGPGELVLLKDYDRTSPLLMAELFRGRNIASAQLVLRNQGQAAPVFVLTLGQVFVTTQQVLGSEGEERLLESLGLTYTSLQLSVTNTSAPADPVTTTSPTWDFLTKTAVNGAPPTVVIAGTGLTTAEDTASEVAFTANDDTTVPDSLVYSATSSNTALVATGGLAFSGSGTARKVTITPVANASGTSTITVTARDAAGQSQSASFAFTVTPVNDAPVVAPVAAQVTTAGVAVPVAVTLSDVDTAATSLTLTATSGNLAVLPAAGIVVSGSGANRTVTLTPTAAGSAVVTLRANDGALNSANVTFTLSVNGSTTGIPTDITLSASTVAENAAAGTVVGTLGVVDADSPTGHTYTLLDNAGGRFALGTGSPARLVVADGTLLNYETATTHNVTVRVTDPNNNAFTRTLAVSVTNVNEAPVLSLGGLAELGALTPGAWVTLNGLSLSDPDAGALPVRVTLTVYQGVLECAATGALTGKVTGNQTATVVIEAPLADVNTAMAAGALRYRAPANFVGDDLLSATISDLGNTGSGGALTDQSMAALTIGYLTFDTWQRAHFSEAELSNPALSGAGAVLHADGFTNLLKYALGLNPRVVATTGLPQISTSEGEWVFTYVRPSANVDLVYTVEVSTNLTTWSAEGVTHEPVDTESAPGTQVWRGRYPVSSAANLYVRLKVSLQPPS